MRNKKLVLSVYLLFAIFTAFGKNDTTWFYSEGNLLFQWNLLQDQAKLTLKNGSPVWKGSLLPSFWLQDKRGKRYLKPSVDLNASRVSSDSLSLVLRFAEVGTGRLVIEKREWGLDFKELK